MKPSRLTLLVVFVLLLAALACARGTDPVAPSDQIDQVEGADPPDFTPIPRAGTALGEPARAHGLELTALHVLDPAEPVSLPTPAEGRRVAVQVRVRSASRAEPLAIAPSNFVLVDDHGAEYEQVPGGTPGELAAADLAPGDVLEGALAYSLPAGRTPSVLRLVLEGGVIVLDTGLTP